MLTPDGLITKKQQDIIADMKEVMYRDVSRYLDLSEKSSLGIVTNIFARNLADLWEAMSEVFDAFRIDKAEGKNLDDIVALNGLYRYPPKRTRGTAEFTGNVGTVVPVTTRLRSNSGDSFNPISQFNISTLNCLETNLTVNTIKYNEKYVIIIDNVEYSYIPVGSDSALVILQQLADSINGGTIAKATVDTAEEILKVYREPTDVIARNKPMTLTASSYMTTGLTTTPAEIHSEQYGAIIAFSGSIISIDTPVRGLESVYNRYDLVTGSDTETDEELRQRFLASFNVTGTGTLDAIISRVRETKNVTTCIGRENPTEVVDPSTGMPAKSFQIVVTGGDNDDIAQAIWDTKPAGIRAYGSYQGTAKDIDGNSHVLYFTRPVPKYVYVKVSWSKDTEIPLDRPEAQVPDAIKSAILEYGQTLVTGSNIIPNKIQGYIYSNITGLVINELTVAVNTSQVVPDPSAFGTAPIPIDSTEYTVWDSQQITVTEV